jgi:hypothetical protein
MVHNQRAVHSVCGSVDLERDRINLFIGNGQERYQDLRRLTFYVFVDLSM